MLDKRSNDGATSVHYTMKTPHSAPRPSPGPRSSHSHSHSQSKLAVPAAKSPKPSTPAASPRMPYSVGQSMPPQKLSPARQPEARAASPNYFGLVVEQSVDPRDSSAVPRDNWSSPTSSVKSFGAALPKQVPIDANPDYEAFKRQADLNRGVGFSLSSSHFPQAPPNPTTLRPRPARWNTHASDTASDFSIPRVAKERPMSRMEVDQQNSHDSAYVSSDSKRNSEASVQPPNILNLNMPRFESPRHSESPFESRTTLSKVEDRHPRLSIPQNKMDAPAPTNARSNQPRAETLPPTMESGPSLITPSQLKDLIEADGSESDLLLLDLRVSQQYAQARIEGALNLCIPTTLLKRATFNLTKLQKTFQSPAMEERFSKWKSTKHLVVYDAYSAEKRDAVSCMNMVKKFTNEGYTGGMYVLRGGFNAFADAYPELVDEGYGAVASGSSPAAANDGKRPGIAPVIGGVMLPMTQNNANPFFSNIRQNMDLADGVGQLDIARPSGLESPTLPRWLRDASKPSDHGKQVSEKFLNIEKAEQSRMKAAYSMFGGAEKDKSVPQLCGIEKGGKNRYKDILPFEHARVKLQGRPDGACDYVNASHIKASRSNKRYIASQGPLPATFEDFWSVIWEQDVRVVVMLTAESEGGQLKCHPYWQGRDFGSIKLKPLSEKKVSLDFDRHRTNQGSSAPSAAAAAEAGRRRANTTTTLGGSNAAASPMPAQGETPYVIIRKFALSHASHPFAPMREITHLHYPSWPDFGAPAQPSHLLALVEMANVMQRSARPVDTSSVSASRTSPEPGAIAWYDEPEMDQRARPMLVHCSAGCGRTGTFCTVDTVIDMLKRQRLAKTNTKPVRKRDSDGDIKMSGQSEEPSPREKTFDFNPGSRRQSGDVRRGSPDKTPLDTTWLADDSDTMDLIQKTVEDFRNQRLSMVQSLRQYVLCYETILEYVWRVHEKNSSANKGGRARSGSLQIRGDN
ncbi:protein-tyrosine phosphatase [Colletotrichum tofieldiae]|uniref:protein-tyrosine-phosphatase n=1 Tax=Colletotrichum tofieldiae TaxID=708197 RepID=A0A166XPH1_9PEZI|nr:protein-tyrosine phosphatase [Colletotrichum tofieldiae]GKT56341.1 protein-tyrosine phosphatase [Colletotrichum tofieldiae]GKT76690.1 protein-tyrosine phosphatase [Colletotrichum tofieldiae]GKT87742.1 protein-tyrosine phosphatase [Colletotrichum tofieldiae]